MKQINKQWDYQGWKISRVERNYFTQHDWNVTLRTHLNRIAEELGLEKNTRIRILVPEKMRELFKEPLYGYNYQFELIYHDYPLNIILIGAVAQLEILNYEPIKTDIDRFIDLYSSVGIDLIVNVIPDKEKPILYLHLNGEECDFFGTTSGETKIIFDKYGMFIKQEIEG